MYSTCFNMLGAPEGNIPGFQCGAQGVVYRGVRSCWSGDSSIRWAVVWARAGSMVRFYLCIDMFHHAR